MGFSTEVLFIKPAASENQILELLQKLTGEVCMEIGETTISQADRRGSFGIYIGETNGATVILYEGLLSARDSNHLNDCERKLIEQFPDRDLLTIANYESSNFYSYHLIQGGKTIRLKSGAHPDVEIDFGQELDLEKANYVKREIENGVEYFYVNSFYKPGEFEKLTHDQIGGSVAFDMAKMMTGINYNHIDMLGVKVKQYISKSEYDRVIAKFNLPELNVYELHHYWNNKLPISVYNSVIEFIESKLSSKGFTYDPQANQFVRKKGLLKQVVDLKCQETGKYFVQPAFRFYVGVDYQKWHIENFGSDKNRLGSRITDDIPINLQEIGIQRSGISVFNHDFHVDTIFRNIETILSVEIVPFFEKVNSIHEAIKYAKGFYKLDITIMLGDMVEAAAQFDSLLNLLITTSSKYDEQKKEHYLLEFIDRAKLLNLDIDVRKIFEDRVTRS